MGCNESCDDVAFSDLGRRDHVSLLEIRTSERSPLFLNYNLNFKLTLGLSNNILLTFVVVTALSKSKERHNFNCL